MNRTRNHRLCSLILATGLATLATNGLGQEGASTITLRTIQDRRGPIATPPLSESNGSDSSFPTDGPLPLGKDIPLNKPEQLSTSGAPSASKSFLLFVKEYLEGVKPLFTLHLESDGTAVVDPQGTQKDATSPMLDVTKGAALLQKESESASRRERENARMYRLKSPQAVMGIRGTQVGYFVAPKETVAIVYEGLVSLSPSPSSINIDNFHAYEAARIDASQRPDVFKLSDKAKLNALVADYPELSDGNWFSGFTYLPTGPGWIVDDFEHPRNPNTAGYAPEARAFTETKKVFGMLSKSGSGAKSSHDPFVDKINYFWPNPDLTLYFAPTDIARYRYLSIDMRTAEDPPKPARKWSKLLVYIGPADAAGAAPHLVIDLEDAGLKSRSGTWHHLILDLGKYPSDPPPDPRLANVLYLRAVADADFAPADLKAEAVAFDQIGLYHDLPDLISLHPTVSNQPADGPVPGTVLSLPLREHPIGTSETSLMGHIEP